MRSKKEQFAEWKEQQIGRVGQLQEQLELLRATNAEAEAMNGVSQEIMECQRESETAAKQLEELEQELQLYMNQKRLIDNKIADVLGDKY